MMPRFQYLTLLMILMVSFSVNQLSANTNQPYVTQKSEEIANISKNFLYNFDKVQIQQTLSIILEQDKRIKAVKVIDSIEKKPFFTYYTDSQTFFYNQPIPENYLQFPKVSIPLYHGELQIGILEFYHQYALIKNPTTQTDNLLLSDTEKSWISDNPTITVGIFEWWPLLSYQEEEKGFFVDYLNIIARQTGLKIQYVHGSFKELYSDFQSGKIDILPGVSDSPDRGNVGVFSSTIIRLNYSIYSSKDGAKELSQLQLNNKTIANIDGDIIQAYLREKYTGLKILEVDSPNAAIEAVLSNKADALVGAQIVIDSRIDQNLITGLTRINHTVAPRQQQHLLVQNSLPLLSSIIEKSLAQITPAQKLNISSQYFKFDNYPKRQSKANLSYDYALLVIVFIALFILLLISARLMKNVTKNFSFGSDNFERIIQFCIAIFVTVCLIGSWIILTKNKSSVLAKLDGLVSETIANTEKNLSTMLGLYAGILKHITGKSYFTEQFRELERAVKNNNLQAATIAENNIIEFWSKYNSLSKELSKQLFLPNGEILFQHDIKLSKSYIQENFSKAFAKALAGQVTFIPPKELGDGASASNQQKVFIVAPIFNKQGHVIAIIVSEMAPEKDFYNNVRNFISGRTTEVFVINRNGLFLSKSRFENELKSLGVLKENQQSIYTLNAFPKHQQQVRQLLLLETRNNDFTNLANIPITEIEDYRGKNTYAKMVWSDKLNVALVAKIDVEEALEQYYAFRFSVISIILLMLSFTIPSILFTLRLGSKANSRLKHSKQELEKRVLERTSELAKVEAQARSLLASIGQGLIGFDNDYKVIFINDAAIKLLAFKDENLIGSPILPRIIPSYDISQCIFIKTIETGQTITRSDQFFKNQLNNKFPVEYTCRAIIQAGVTKGCVIVFSDISERIAMEEALKLARNEAEDALQAKSEFFANMSHEIRTPMNAILGMTHLVLQSDLNPKQHNFITKVHSSAKSLLGIINDILDFSKMDADKMHIEKTPFYIDEVLENVTNAIALKTEEKHLELLFDIDHRIPEPLVGDPLRLSQIFLNLANNAVKFAEKGEVLLRIKLVSETASNVTLESSIEDKGIGISEYNLKKLFNSFTQADNSTTRRYGGTGLGLAICKRLVELMGGRIWVSSELGQGSTFSFSTLFEKASEQVPVNTVPEINLKGKRALVVDDNSIARLVLEKLLNSLGYTTDLAENGAQALEKIATASKIQAYDLVLLDWKMPVMDGIEAAYNISLKYPKKERPIIIIVTAFGSESMMISADSNQHIDAFLTKPLIRSKLVSLLNQIKGVASSPKELQQSINEKNEAALASLRGARILLVEDNEINQELAQELLRTNGMRVSVANNGQEALDILEEYQFDGVLMDCQMPIMDGYQATKRLREQPRFKNLPILAMTANAMSSDKEKVLSVGMNDHIAKPIDVTEMLVCMAKWISTEKNNSVDDVKISLPDKAAPITFVDIEGLETDKGLKICQGNSELYKKILLKFVDNQNNFHEHFQQALIQKDSELMIRQAHTLKGVAGNIGATELYKSTMQLESSIANEHSEQDIKELLNIVKDQLLSLCIAINNLISLEPIAEVEAIDLSTAQEKLTELRALIEDNDTDALELFEQLQQLFSTNPKMQNKVKDMTKAVNGYDFDEALELLNELESSLSF